MGGRGAGCGVVGGRSVGGISRAGRSRAAPGRGARRLRLGGIPISQDSKVETVQVLTDPEIASVKI